MYSGAQSLSSNGDIHMCRYACDFVSVVALVIAHVLVFIPLAGYLYGRLTDTDAKELLQLWSIC